MPNQIIFCSSSFEFFLFSRKFSLSFCDSLTDKSLDKIKNFEKLKYLQLKKGANFTNLGILDLLRNLRNVEGQGLQHLNLSECSSLSDECLHALSQRYVLEVQVLLIHYSLFPRNLSFAILTGWPTVK